MFLSSILFVFSSSFMALFPVINPIGTALIVNGYLSNLSAEHRAIAIRKLIINYLIVGLGTLAIGHLFLFLFGLAIPVIQIGGGLLICRTAIGLLSDSDTSQSFSDSQTDLSASKWNDLENHIFYPITFPISIDPGSIAVIFTLMASSNDAGDVGKTIINYLIIAVVILVMATILYLLLFQGDKMMQRLGRAGNLVLNKLIAFFTFCIGIQIMLEGISSAFHLKLF